jgi:KinB signaling pathway activation protein
MSLRRFWILAGTTVLLGALVGFVGSFFTGLGVYYGIFSGAFASATSLMGFWAYLTLNVVARGWRFWKAVQLFLTGLVFFDMVYFRYMFEAQGRGPLLPYLVYAAIPLAAGVFTGMVKRRISGKGAFIPTLFYVFCFTIVEWIPALRTGETLPMTQIGLVLLCCNCYLILILGKIIHPRRPGGGMPVLR